MLKSAIQAAVLNRLGDVGRLDFFAAREIGDRAADFEDSAVGAGAQAQFVNRGLEQPLAVVVHRTIALDIPCAHLGIGMDVSFLEAVKLDGARIIDPLANELGRFAGVSAREILVADRRHFYLNVDAVEKRAGDAGAITLDLKRRADALFLRVGEKATRTSLRYLSAISGFRHQSQSRLSTQKS